MIQNFTNSCITDPLEHSTRSVASSVVYGLVLGIGLPLNTVSLWILLRSHGLRSPCAVLMVNLAASDMLLALSLPLRVYFYATLQWPFGAVSCAGAIMLFRINIRTSSIFITLISLDRMVALVFPLRSRSLRTSACALKSCALVWTLTTIYSIVETIKIHGFMKKCAYIPCFEFQVLQKAPQSPAILQALFLLILLVVNVVSTAVVVVVLQRRPNAGTSKVNNKMNVVLIFLVNLLVFTVFFLPFTLQLLAYNKDGSDRTVIQSLICLASVNCCLDPLIYYFSLDSFWQDKGKKQTDAGTYSLSRSMDRS